MDQAIMDAEKQKITLKLQQLQLSETDDDNCKQLSDSPLMDSKIHELLKKIPSQIRQLYYSLGPLYEILNTYQILSVDGSVYFGEVQNNKKHGTGIEIWPQLGNILDGIWENDTLMGNCRMIYSNQEIFECIFINGRANGFGIFQSKKKLVKGIWIDNFLQGEGQEIRADGQKYYGQFRNSQKNGQGIIYYQDGCKYEGQLKSNKINGYGALYWNDGSSYNGRFEKGLIRGEGTYCNGNGQIMNGNFEEVIDQNKIIQRIQYINEVGIRLWIEKIRWSGESKM